MVAQKKAPLPATDSQRALLQDAQSDLKAGRSKIGFRS